MIKVPVLSLDPGSASNWSRMLVGRGSTWSRAVAFEKPQATGSSELEEPDLASLNEEDNLTESHSLPPEQIVQQFRMSSSPTAKRLAGFLAAAPVINLPVVRLLQQTMLPESRQAHVAEVFLGGLLKAIAPIPITESTNPEGVLYDFRDEVREIVLNTLPTVYQITVLEEISKYVETWLGKSLSTFDAMVKENQTDVSRANLVKPFAKIRKELLKKFRLAGYLSY